MPDAVELATILLTDLVDSTELAHALGPTGADELREEHFELLRAAVASSGGREVKNMGDGLMVAFSSASAAVRCAASMQQLIERRYRHSDHTIHIRVGLGAGESTVKDGDYFGMPTTEAARLCAEAPGDGILASATVRMLAGRAEGVCFEPAGRRALKGFPEAVETFSVAWESIAEESATVPGWPLPSPLRAIPTLRFVGRFEERELLERTLDHAHAGVRQLVLIAGEPGIGKTRLAGYIAHQAHARGFAVCWGGCSEDLAAPYEPWIEVCSQLVEYLPEDLLARHVGRHRGELQRIAHGLAGRLAGVPEPQVSDSETERYLLFATVVGLLKEVAQRMPLCLVLDDLHWGDAQSIALLKHLVRDVESDSLVVIATYRDSDLASAHPLTGVLADLRAVAGAHRVSLGGLTPEDVAHILQAVAGHELDAEGIALAEDIAGETAGNPFFAGEIVRGLSESGAFAYDEASGRWRVERGAAHDLPQSVREIVERRVERLGHEVADTLRLASVIGRSFDVRLLAACSEPAEERILDHLEAAVAASLLGESGERLGEFYFQHALINQTLYEGLGPTRRARTHRRVGVALEQLDGDGDGERLAALALHWRLATSAEDVRKAADYARRAGKRALERLAPADAARLFRDALELANVEETRERCEALVGLGEAQRQIGESAYRETLLEASRIASEIADPELAAEAALANSRGSYSLIGEVDEQLVGAIQRALALDDPPVPARRARLLALEAQEIEWRGEQPRRRALADEALSLAREAGDARALGAVLLNAYYAYWNPGTLEQATAVARELAENVKTVKDPALEFWAEVVQLNGAIETADPHQADALLELLGGMSQKLGQPILAWVASYNQAGWGLMRLPIAAAEVLVERALQLGQDAGEPDAVFIYGAQLASIRAYAGRGGEIIEMLEQSVDAYPAFAGWRAAMAHVYCLLGRTEEAGAVVEAAAANGFADVPRDQTYTTAIALYADAAAQAGASQAAAVLYELIEPWGERIVWNGATGFGHGRLWQGLLAATLGSDELADRHFEEACTVQDRAGLLLWSCYTRLCWGETLARRGEEERAREQGARAMELARAYGYGAYEDRAAALISAAAPAGVRPSGPARVRDPRTPS